MPELPEVETIRGGLEEALKGQKLVSIEVRVPKLFFGEKSEVEGKILIDIGRRAKMLILDFQGVFLAIHLKMTGQLIYIPTATREGPLIGGHPDKVYSLDLPHKHTHIILEFEKGTLFYNDVRKFGWMRVVDKKKLEKLVADFGPEYEWPEFTPEYLQKKFMKRPGLLIKRALLDQGIVTGLGNIYSDEVLFCAHLKPNRKNGDLSKKDIEKIHQCIPKIFKLALKQGGTSLRDFRHVNGGYGSYLSFAKVYGRAKLPCKVCGAAIKTIRIGSRTSSYCPKCQK